MDYGQLHAFAANKGQIFKFGDIQLLLYRQELIEMGFKVFPFGLIAVFREQVWADVLLFAVLIHKWVVLAYYIRHLRQRAKLSPDYLVNKVVKVAVVLLCLIFCAFYRKLDLALHPVHEEDVYEDVVVLQVQPVLDSQNLQDFRVFILKFLESGQNFNEFLLSARTLAPHQVSDLKRDQVKFLQKHFIRLIIDIFGGFLRNCHQRVDQLVDVPEDVLTGDFGQLSRQNAGLDVMLRVFADVEFLKQGRLEVDVLGLEVLHVLLDLNLFVKGVLGYDFFQLKLQVQKLSVFGLKFVQSFENVFLGVLQFAPELFCPFSEYSQDGRVVDFEARALQLFFIEQPGVRWYLLANQIVFVSRLPVDTAFPIHFIRQGKALQTAIAVRSTQPALSLPIDHLRYLSDGLRDVLIG